MEYFYKIMVWKKIKIYFCFSKDQLAFFKYEIQIGSEFVGVVVQWLRLRQTKEKKNIRIFYFYGKMIF